MSHRLSHDRSVAEPSAFWAEQADRVVWYRAPQDTLQALPDGSQAALIYDSSVTDTQQRFSYTELQAGRDLGWRETLARAQPADPVEVVSGDPLYIMHTSGTTGKPKGIVRDNGGHAVALSYAPPSTIDDPAILGEIAKRLGQVGFVKAG